jgi:hypothetical protein
MSAMLLQGLAALIVGGLHETLMWRSGHTHTHTKTCMWLGCGDTDLGQLAHSCSSSIILRAKCEQARGVSHVVGSC